MSKRQTKALLSEPSAHIVCSSRGVVGSSDGMVKRAGECEMGSGEGGGGWQGAYRAWAALASV